MGASVSVLGNTNDEEWPALPPSTSWAETYATLHMWLQIVGKICLATTPLVNHWWNAAFTLTARGFDTRSCVVGARSFTMSFDFIAHQLTLRSSDGREATLPLRPRSVSSFYEELTAELKRMGFDVVIWTKPVEIAAERAISFELDEIHASYDARQVSALFRALLAMRPVLETFRAEFVGKCSPVHFFWGSFDLCCTRFSGRRAPQRPLASFMEREAYSHECISHGFWPGTLEGPVHEPCFYAYAVPEPARLRESIIGPRAAYYDDQLREFLLPYEDVRTSTSPAHALREFLHSTYDVAASLAGWDRSALERFPPETPSIERDVEGVALDDVDVDVNERATAAATAARDDAAAANEAHGEVIPERSEQR